MLPKNIAVSLALPNENKIFGKPSIRKEEKVQNVIFQTFSDSINVF